jgi:hypothetical protein
MLAHTPAPWTLHPAPSGSSMMSIRGPAGEAIAFVNRRPNAAANAALLVHAGELLEAAKDYARVSAEPEPYGERRREELRSRQAASWQRLSAAIAKIEGRES